MTESRISAGAGRTRNAFRMPRDSAASVGVEYAPVCPPTPQIRRAAQLACARHATDRDDLRQLLDALDLKDPT